MQERRENVIVIKSESFADRIIKMCKYLSKKETGDMDMNRNSKENINSEVYGFSKVIIITHY